MSSFLKIVILSEHSRFNLEFIFTLPTSDKSYLDELKNKLSKEFINYHLIPMVSAIWSMPPLEATQMPLSFFLNFFKNHGLFKIKDRPQWFTVANRSKTYVDKVLKKISGEYFKNYKINKITRSADNVRITIGNEYLDYDNVILASHADQSLKMLENPTVDE